MTNGKAKGNNFERECSRMLSLWWTSGRRDDAIWRSASSGALTTVGKGRYLAHTGDFAATDGEAALLFEHVIIEAKRGYSRYSMQDLLDVPEGSLVKNPVCEMVTKLNLSCEIQHKWGLLLWKRDRRNLLVFTLAPRSDLQSFVPPERNPWMTVWLPTGNFLYGMPWDQFAAIVSGARIASLLTQPVASSESKPVTPS